MKLMPYLQMRVTHCEKLVIQNEGNDDTAIVDYYQAGQDLLTYQQLNTIYQATPLSCNPQKINKMVLLALMLANTKNKNEIKMQKETTPVQERISQGLNSIKSQVEQCSEYKRIDDGKKIIQHIVATLYGTHLEQAKQHKTNEEQQ